MNQANDIKLLPPAQGATSTAASQPQGMDMAAFASQLKGTPKQDYSAQWKADEPKPAEPKAAETGSGNAPGSDASSGGTASGDAPGSTENPNSTGSAKETANAVLLMYDNLVCQICAALADHKDFPAKSFSMDGDTRKEAARQLAIGIEKNNWAGLPWWGILAALLVASGVGNWLLVREARRKKKTEDEDAKRNRERAKNQEAVHPSTITDKTGRTTPMPDVPPPVHSTAPNAPGAPKDYGPCQAPGCTNRLLKPRRKYCGKSCSGKASAKSHQSATATA